MDIVVFQSQQSVAEALRNFRNLYFNSQMKYLASDLLNEGLSHSAIWDAVQRAITVCKTTNLEISEHFQPIYTETKGMIIKDCKLSRLGYGLVLLNAAPSTPIVAQWQLKLVGALYER